MRHVCLAEARTAARINLQCAECMAVWARGATAGLWGASFSIGLGIVLGNELNNIVDPMVGPTCEILAGIGFVFFMSLWPLSQAVQLYTDQELAVVQAATRSERELQRKIREKYLYGGRERLRSGKGIYQSESSHVAA